MLRHGRRTESRARRPGSRIDGNPLDAQCEDFLNRLGEVEILLFRKERGTRTLQPPDPIRLDREFEINNQLRWSFAPLRMTKLNDALLADFFGPCFEILFHLGHELVGDGAVDEAMIVA